MSNRSTEHFGMELEMFVIYENPKDYPGKFVVRRWTVGQGGPIADPEPLAIENTVHEARGFLPRDATHPLYRLEPQPNDDPVIREVWI